ncbi:sialin isoform X2 [Diachasma alloeum]|uniref:sialin isoform X2 n=1 Tax=Diachasma alloeum TaxID=454923 RepID=UPI00073842D0|nr:sialin isoform X2 [Diachasma alloeum]
MNRDHVDYQREHKKLLDKPADDLVVSECDDNKITSIANICEDDDKQLPESPNTEAGFKRIIRRLTGIGWLSCRNILWYLVFTGGIVNYMIKVSLNLVIVAMVIPRTEKPSSLAECDAVASLAPNFNSTFHSYEMLNQSSVIPDIEQQQQQHVGNFNWTEYQQGLALGAFYWSYWTTQVPGGILAQKYGTKLVFGGANFLASLLGLLIPTVIKWHFNVFLVLRVLQGVILGVVSPSTNVMTAKWIPPNERSKFVSAYMGGSVGIAITYPLCAFIITYFNWEAAFYFVSGICIIWYCFWLFFMFDSPQQHPRIAKEELEYILANTPASLTASRKRAIPWKAILISRPMWVTAVAHWGATWGFYTLLAQGPTYFRFIHGWDLNAIGLIAGVPHILLMIFSYLFGWWSDWLLKSGKMTRTGVRKLAITMCTGVQAAFTVGLSLSGCQSTLAVVFMLMGTTVTGGISAGTVANLVDLSPNFSSILLGICGLSVNGVGAISPLIVGVLTNDNQTIGQWRLVFLIAAANMMIGFIIFMIWGTANEQSWNFSIEESERAEEILYKEKDVQLFEKNQDESSLSKS